jgi:hypothetical protein
MCCICFTLEFTEIVHFIVMFVEFVWMSNFVEITGVVKILHMTNVAFVWRYYTNTFCLNTYFDITKNIMGLAQG